MRKFIVRVVELLVVLFLVSIGVFALVSLVPGDPVVSALGEGRPPEVYEQAREQLGLNDPLMTRYFDWLGGALRGDFGVSMVDGKTEVADRIAAALPVSLQLAAMALILALIISVPLAMYAASHAGGPVDRVISAFNFGILSVPSFLSALLLVMVFANQLHWFPRSFWTRPSESIVGNLESAFLPVVAIALMETAYFIRVLRNDLVVTLQEDYVLAARARGMKTWRILFVDALRPSSFSLVTMLGLSLGTLIGSTVIVESVFSLPGMGSMLVTAVNQGDFTIIQGGVLVIALIYVVANLVIDFAYELLDPRTRRATA